MLCNIKVMDKVRKKVFYFSANKQTSLIKHLCPKIYLKVYTISKINISLCHCNEYL